MNNDKATSIGNSSEIIRELNVVPEALIAATFPNGNEVSVVFIKNIMYCNLDNTYSATKEILVHHKRKLERYSFKDLFKSDRVWIVNSYVNSRVMFGQVSRLVSIIMSLLSSVEDIQVRHIWSDLCIKLLAKEIPEHSQLLSEVRTEQIVFKIVFSIFSILIIVFKVYF